MKRIVLILLLLVPSVALAQFKTGQVVTGSVAAVHDGDTFTMNVAGSLYSIRLRGADAPEMQVKGRWPQQPGALDAKDCLESLLREQPVEVTIRGQSYGRYVADVRAGRIADVSASMLYLGWAMADPRYATKAHKAAEADARELKRGLWSPVKSPWEWRKQNQKNRPKYRR